MHPSDKQWWLTHSGDYVLGLLSNADRLVFERIMQVDPNVKELVVDWRERMQPMSDALTPVEPPDDIFTSLAGNLPMQPITAASTAFLSEDAHTQRLHDEALDDEPTSLQQAEEQAEVLADGTAFQRLLDKKQQALDSSQKSADGWRSFAGLATIGMILLGSLLWIGR